MAVLLWLMCFFVAQEEVPFKPKEEFEVVLNFEFRQREIADRSQINFQYEKRTSTGPLPYLKINLNVLKKGHGESRLRVMKNTDVRSVSSRKIEEGMQVKLDLGFTDDIKDRVSAHEYVAYFLSDDKKALSRVVLYVDKDGTYYVNGEKRGRL